MLNQSVVAETVETTPRTARKPLCPECGAEFTRNRPQQNFCSPAHKTAFQARAMNEGRAILALAKAWRASRNAKGNSPEAVAAKEVGSKAFSEMVAIVDGFMAEDRAAGRPNPIPYAKSILAQGRFCDRQRRR